MDAYQLQLLEMREMVNTIIYVVALAAVAVAAIHFYLNLWRH